MRYIDEIIKAIQEHPRITPVHKQVLIDRVEKLPTQEEISQAAKKVYP